MAKLCARLTALVIAGYCLLGLTGCSGNKQSRAVAAMNQSNVQRLSNLYAAYQNYKGGRGPKDEAEFKTFIQQYDPDKLKMMGVDSAQLDRLFTSERDGKPFVVRYKVGGGRGSVDAVVFEQDGKDGKKQVGYTGGKVEEADDGTYRQLLAGKGTSEPAGAAPVTGTPGRTGRATGPPPGAPMGPSQP